MTDTVFTMAPAKQGRIKYLLLTLVPPMLVTYAWKWLMECGILPSNRAIVMIGLFLAMAALVCLGCFLIFQRNHVLEVSEGAILHHSWRGSTSTIQVNQIRSFRRNFLNELLLLDENGKVLLCVESNMSNLDLFRQWLESHHIMNQTKEK